MITFDAFVDMICISLNNYLDLTRSRIRLLIPTAILHIMHKHQWECTTKTTTLTTSITEEYVNLPDDFDKERSLRRPNFKKPIEYITPEKWNEKKSESSTPYGAEAVKYTIMSGDGLRQKRIYFLDPPTSAMIINMIYNIKVAEYTIPDLPDEFIPLLASLIIYRMTPPMIENAGIKQSNPSFVTARDDYRSNLRELISWQEGQRGREIAMELDDVAKNAYQYFHK